MGFRSGVALLMGAIALFGAPAWARDIVIEWRQNLEEDTVVLNVGDNLVFEWPSEESHSVWELSDLQSMENCDFSGEEAGMLSQDPGYTWEATDEGEYYFACDHDNHCSDGQMKLHVVVVDDGESPAPTSGSPAPAPTSEEPADTPEPSDEDEPTDEPADEPSEEPSDEPTDEPTEEPGDGANLRPCSSEEQSLFVACSETFAEDESACLGTTDLSGDLYGCSWCAQGDNQGCTANINCRAQGNATIEANDGEANIQAEQHCETGGGTFIPGEFKGEDLESSAGSSFPSIPLTLGTVALTLIALI